MREVFIVGVGMTQFARHLDLSVRDLAVMGVEKALKDADIDMGKIQSVFFSNSNWGYFSAQQSIRGQVALRDFGLMGIPITNVENACASGSTALQMAWLNVASGLDECSLAVGAEKIYCEDKAKMFKSFWGGVDIEQFSRHVEAWRKQMKDLEDGDLDGAGEKRSPFMDIYSMACRWHMKKYGTTRKQLAVIAAKNHFHGSMNSNAQFQHKMEIGQILDAPVVTWPLTIPMCAPVGDGGSAAIVCSKSFLKKVSHARPVKIMASVLGSGTSRTLDEEERDIAVRLSRTAYETSGIGPEDIDLAEVHDATAFGELHQTEALGFCDPGTGGALAESGATKLGGRLPVNTSGGLESRGHPIGASGLGQIHEIVTQLRHEAGDRQVEGCRIGLAENGGGFLGFEEAAMGIHILKRTKHI